MTNTIGPDFEERTVLWQAASGTAGSAVPIGRLSADAHSPVANRMTDVVVNG